MIAILPVTLGAVFAGAGAGTTTTAAGGGIISGLTAALGPQLAQLGLTSKLQRQRFPASKPGDIAKIAVAARELAAQGYQPVVTEDPFTGNVVIGTADQNIQQLLQERALLELSRPSAEEIRELEELRLLAATSPFVPRGSRAPPTVTPPVPNGMAIVGFPAAVRPTRRFESPGRVSQGGLPTRLSGPCAGVVSGLQKIRCARGGFQ